jgi:hypothetical protein
MHYVFGCLDGRGLPDQLPYDMIPPTRRHNAGAVASTPAAPTPAPAPAPAAQPAGSPAPPSAVQTPTAPASSRASVEAPAVSATETVQTDWVVTAEEAHNYEAFFKSADKDNDGVVSGKWCVHVKDCWFFFVFLDSRVTFSGSPSSHI